VYVIVCILNYSWTAFCERSTFQSSLHRRCILLAMYLTTLSGLSDYVASNGGMVNELDIMWKETAVAWFEPLRRHLPRALMETKKKVRKISTGVTTKIRTGYLKNTRQNRYCFSYIARCIDADSSVVPDSLIYLLRNLDTCYSR
jgi:hypothetical protein